MGTSINLLRSPIAASHARLLLAYLFDMSRRSLRGSLPSGLLVTISRSALMRFFAFCYLFCCSMAFAYQQNVSAPNEPQGISLPPNNQIWLPELKGVVSWKTLAQVTPTKQKGKLVPEFSKEVESLNKKEIRLQGFMMPLEMGDKQKRFLLSAFPPHCSFCLTAGPDSLIEVLAKTPIKYGFEPIVLSGRFAVLKDDPAGLYYRLSEAVLLSNPQ